MLTDIVTMVLSLVLWAFVLIPYCRSEVWWIRVFDFPRLQSMLIALILCAALLTVAQPSTAYGWVALAVTVGFMLVQGSWIWPYTRLGRVEVKQAAADSQSPSIRLLCANVLMDNRKSDDLLALVRTYQPDILVTLETDSWWEQQLDVLQDDYPHTVKHPLDNLYGMHVYSRLPFVKSTVQFLIEDDIPSIHVDLYLGERLVHCHFLHPAPPSPTENSESTERDAELSLIAKQIHQRSKQSPQDAAIVAGDLNDVAWSATTRLFRKVSGLLDPRVGRGMFNTFHADYWPLRWPLDHVFHSDHFALRDMRRLPHIGSDHFPILIELVLQPHRRDAHDGLDAAAEDHGRAGKKLGQADS